MRGSRTVYFCERGEHGSMYRRLARVHEATMRKHHPSWDVVVEEINDPGRECAGGNPSFMWNTHKLEWWADVIRDAADGDEVLLIDADTAILKPLDDVWARDFDIAYTVRERGLPLNGGVVFVRVNPRSQHFVEEWRQVNRRFFTDPVEHAPWRAKYAGMNQAAFGCVLETVEHSADLLKLPCREWNCVAHEGFSDQVTRVLHVKSKLRRATFGKIPTIRVQPMGRRLVNLWHSLEEKTNG